MKASQSVNDTLDFIPTGFVGFDAALGGGIPSKKITEISGRYSMGKSTLALQLVAQAQRLKKKCLWADSELSYHNAYAATLGVQTEELELLQQTEYAESLLDGIEEWAAKHKNGLIVLDAVGALLPREESEKGAEGRSIGLQARLLGSFCRRIVPIITRQNHALLILNHEFIDVQNGRLKTSGGMKLEYAKSIWFTLKRTFGKQPKRNGDGTRTVIFMEAEIRKNKVAPTEGTKVELEMVVGHGFVTNAAELVPPKRRGRPPGVTRLTTEEETTAKVTGDQN